MCSKTLFFEKIILTRIVAHISSSEKSVLFLGKVVRGFKKAQFFSDDLRERTGRFFCPLPPFVTAIWGRDKRGGGGGGYAQDAFLKKYSFFTRFFADSSSS